VNKAGAQSVAIDLTIVTGKRHMERRQHFMKVDIVRAWKDKRYRQSLSPEEQALLPENPAGAISLTDEDLGRIAGGVFTRRNDETNGLCCPRETFTALLICCPSTR
jgi:mersacidin/lichenicidin family type 2 lantibiotic